MNMSLQVSFSICKMECYLAIKKEGNLSYATTWMKLEGSILSEISQRKTNNASFHLYVEYVETELIETDNRSEFSIG